MRVYLSYAAAFLLTTVTGPDLASAQTLMDYFVSREKLDGGAECVATAAADCGAPSAYTFARQSAAGCSAVPEVPANACGPAPASSCAAPQPCRPRYVPSQDRAVTAPSCAMPSTPPGCRPAPTAARCGCGCQRAGCRCSQSSQSEDGLKRCCSCCSGWSRAHTTGDLFPHFPYRPEHGGLYYFRPYNWDRIYEHLGRASRWDLHPRNPYSVAVFDVINEDFAQRFAPGVISIPEPPRTHVRGLPNLEALLLDLP